MKLSMNRPVTWVAVFPFICLALLSLDPAMAATNISGTHKYAWSENTGWQNWNSTTAQVTVGTTHLTGYVWAENIGWIKLGSDGGGPYANTSSTDWGVNRNESTGELSGYAWSENAGWINFSPTNGGVTINMAHENRFEGYAWGENVGWIHFQNASPEYYVQQTGPLVVNLVSFTALGFDDVVQIEWSTASELNTAGFHIWRSEVPAGDYARITDALIPAEGGAFWGADYLYEDGDVTPGKTYSYELEDVDTAGTSTFHGPETAWAGTVNIRADGGDGPVTVAQGENLRVTVDVRAGDHAGMLVECWIAARTPFGWFTWAHGWSPGMARVTEMALADRTAIEVLERPLPVGWYRFFLAIDDQLDEVPQPLWVDTVDVRVE